MQDIDDFVARWKASGVPDRGVPRQFLTELCDVLDLPPQESARPVSEDNNYSFDRGVYISCNACHESRRLDLYKKGCFLVSSAPSHGCGSEPTDDAGVADPWLGQRGTRSWENSMLRAMRIAEQYVRRLPPKEGRPPFLIVVDVGYCFDLYADFACNGGYYLHFPDCRRHRIFLDELVKPETRYLFRAIWTNPRSLDPSMRAAEVTETVAAHLANLAMLLEHDGHDPEPVSQFLMQCVFSMFAQDVGMLQSCSFTKIVKDSLPNPTDFPSLARSLWEATKTGPISPMLCCEQMQFNGGFFAITELLPLRQEHLLVLLEATTSNWAEVEPAIFGTLLERALDSKERHKLGAHYTPRAYVERLIVPTLMKPLRRDWESVQSTAAEFFRNGRDAEARKVIYDFHESLCEVRVLDPACGTGNFLYVAMEHMKRLESELLQTLESYGETQPELMQIDPHQFLGLEINPRAAQIAEMVLWIGYLQFHFRSHPLENPREPVIRKFRNIQQKDAVLEFQGWDFAVDESGKPISRWNGDTYKTDPVTGLQVPDLSAEVVDKVYKGVTAAKWPKADFVVGNPPFIGGKDKKQVLGHGYFDALRETYPMLPDSCDYVMYWWHKAAELVRTGKIRQFGFITTNSISQVFNRRVLSLHMESEKPMHLAFAVPDHPWADARNSASVRIAMTVGANGSKPGTLSTVQQEHATGGSEINVVVADKVAVIHSNLRQGADITKAVSLKSNEGISTTGVKLHGSGFIVTRSEAVGLGLGRISGLERHIRHYRNGRDIAIKPRGVMVIDLHGLSAQDVQDNYPEVYQWVFTRVKPERDLNRQECRRKNWWLFGGTNTVMRSGLAELPRYISTIETSMHRYFVFLPAEVLPDNKLINVASDDAYILGVLSSRIHVSWALAAGAKFVAGAVYVKSVCFDAFPFPDATSQQRLRIRELGEKLDAHRKSRQELYPDLTLSGMYNVHDALRTGRPLTAAERTIHEHGLLIVLRNLHDELDAAVADAYGWAADLPNDDIITRLVELNAERANEEKEGNIRWLRPDYQTMGVAARHKQSSLDIDASGHSSTSHTKSAAPTGEQTEKSDWPSDPLEQTGSVRDVIDSIRHRNGKVTPERIAGYFAGSSLKRIREILRLLETLGLYGI